MDINVQMSKMQGSNDIELYIANGLLGFEHDGYFIIEPRSSVCGRFEVNPQKEYGLNAVSYTHLTLPTICSV